MKHKFLEDLGIEVDEDEALKKFDIQGIMDQISDNRPNTNLKEKIQEQQNKVVLGYNPKFKINIYASVLI